MMPDKKWQWQEGEYTVTRTCGWSPPGDHPVGCGMKLYVKNGKLVKVEGDPDHPVTQGRLCIRCLTLPEYMHHPQRIVHPMLRVGKRGENKWQQISWDEAYDIIEQKTKETKEKYGPESIVVFGGTGRQASMYYPVFAFGVFGTPNACYPFSGFSCYGPRIAITHNILGVGYPEIDYAGQFPDRYDHPGWELPKYIIVWGKNPLQSNPDGFYGHSIVDMMKRGTKLMVVDPRMTWLASRAEHWLQLRPGTDTALAMGMLNVIINEDLYDKEFVEKWCHGFEELRERVQEYPPERAAEITWVPKEKIVEAARAFGKNKPSSICWGLATDTKVNGVQQAHATIALLAITGNIDVPGGIIIGGAPVWGMRSWEWFDKLPQELQEKMIGMKEYPAYVIGTLMAHADLMLDAMETGKPYPIKMAYINSTNPVAPTNSAAPQRWYEALKKLDFVFATDTFMNPTIQACADLFLPLAAFPEHDGYVTTHYGIVSVVTGAINKALQIGECKAETEIMLELGKRLNPEAWPWNNVEEMFDWALGPNITFKGLREKGWIQPEYQYKKYEKGLLRPDGEPGFATPTGKIELSSTLFPGWGEDPLPYYEEPPYSPYSTPQLAKEYPLILTSGARSWSYFHSEQRQVPTLRALHPEPKVEIHPQTAENLGIHDGDLVYIENMFGKCKMRAKITPIVDPRVVQADHGWWFPEKKADEPDLYGVWEANINTLVPHKLIGKLGFGAPFKCMICKVYKAE